VALEAGQIQLALETTLNLRLVGHRSGALHQVGTSHGSGVRRDHRIGFGRRAQNRRQQETQVLEPSFHFSVRAGLNAGLGSKLAALAAVLPPAAG
jgi:hypothetical protein